MSNHTTDAGREDELVSVCRTAVADELRSVVYFTEADVEQFYRRSDLDRTADLLGFAELERSGFRADQLYRNTQLGGYRATIRLFEHGFLSRVILDRQGVWVTTDSMSIERFEELSTAIESVLETHGGEK